MSKKGIYKNRGASIEKTVGCPAPVPRPAKKAVLGIDPGLDGAFVVTDGKFLKSWPMPTKAEQKDREVDFDGVHELLTNIQEQFIISMVYLERAIPFAQGAKQAFSYGRGFAALEIAIELLMLPVIYVEPAKWTKAIHEGISADLKPKAKSLVALKRRYPYMVDLLPVNTKGKIKEGPLDAFLIAAYGLLSQTKESKPKEDIEDFF